MQFTNAAAASLLLVGSALAQSSVVSMSSLPMSTVASAAAASSSAASGMVTVHVVTASNSAGDLVFAPNDIKANVGDMVQFQFYPKNHSVVQSNFANPCQPVSMTDPTVTSAFFSGFMPTTEMGTLTYTIQVKDTKPIWFYCSQAKHCQEGMVGAINAPATGNTLQAFAAAAKAAANNVTPSSSAAASASSAAGTTVASAATATSAAAAKQTTNAASGLLLDAGKQGILGVGMAGAVALLLL